ncbi:MAG: SH3 domain-containing protein [Chloroflexota bacterium]|nr:MAG: hypothetical protein DLM70_18035 [Chloroflexota bacterium]
MAFRRLACVAVTAALTLSPAQPAHATMYLPRIGLILHDNVLMRSHPGHDGRVIAVLVQQSQVRVLALTGLWAHVRVWASISGWVSKAEVTFRKPWVTVSSYRAPEEHYRVHSHAPQPLRVRATALAALPISTVVNGPPVAHIPAGTNVTISEWAQSATGDIWYRAGKSWAPGENLRFEYTPSFKTRIHASRVLSRVSGKGMWLTLGTVSNNESSAIVSAAVDNGITHLYVESAISPLGFHGRRSVSHLLEAAHRHHLAVIAWVYPYLDDLASDVALTREVAAFRSLSGQRFDGIAADLERNVSIANVRAYSQLTRTYLGTHYLLVGVTYPPQSLPGFPYGEVGRWFNVIAPMDYWHQTRSDYGLDFGHMKYGYDYGYRYAFDSVLSIQRTAGRVPVAPIGQAFDDYGRLEMGPRAPSASETRGFLAGVKASHAIGASFFQWLTATEPEWQEIRGFRL